LKSLNLLGDLDLSDEDSKLTEKELLTKILEDENYKEQKELLEKYISEFVKADLITQSTHLRSGTELVSSSNENWIDGGVYLYRTSEKDKDSEVVDTEDDDDDTTTTTTTTTTTVDTTTKSIDTASYGLTAEEVTVEMDNITHEYKIAWISDLQMMLPTSDKEKDDEWKGKWEKWVQSDITFDGKWLNDNNSGLPYEERMKAYNNSYQILEKIINCLEGNDFDAIVFGGDILDNYTDLNYDYLKEQLEKITNKNVIFLDGDHDYLTDMTTNYNSEEHHEVESLDGLGGKIKTITIGKDGDSITLVGQCDSNNAISNVSLKAIESYLNKTSNSLFFTHVPIESKTQSSSMQEWSKRVHNEQVYYWGTSSSCKYQADNTATYLNTLYNSSSLKGVFAGHVHFSGNFEFNTGVTEHIFQASYNSSIGVITIKPTGNVSSTVEEPEQETEENEDDTTTTVIKEVNSQNYKKMTYISYEEFQKNIEKYKGPVKSIGNFRYEYTIDPNTGELLVPNITTVEERTTSDVSTAIDVPTTYYVDENSYRIDYKSYIDKYVMPYEFLINLCQVTQNPEFVYHVAMLARNTNIMLVIQDDTTAETVTTYLKRIERSLKNTTDDSVDEAEVEGSPSESNYKTVVTTTTMVPHLEVQRANTWSFYEEYEYTKKVTTSDPTYTDSETVYSAPDKLEHKPSEYKPDGTSWVKETPEYWYGTTVEETSYTTTTITTTTYNPGILKNSTEKSKQFLGLLRNSTGECSYDCYNDPSLAKKCAEEAVYDGSESAINVSYRIPYVTRTEMPLNKLTSGEQMLYELLGQSLEGDSSVSADEDYNSQYKTRMQGIIDHMKYLLTFPQNEDVDTTDSGDYVYEDVDEDIDYKDIDYKDIEIADNELQILYKVCEAEAGGSSAEEIGHVASVILNRVKSSYFPNTINGVVFQANQFSCINDGHFETAVPSDKTKSAVDSVIASGDTTGGAFWYRTEESAKKAGMPTNASEKDNFYVFLFEDHNTHIFYTNSSYLSEVVTEESESSDNMVNAAYKIHKYVRENGYKYSQAGVFVPNKKTKTIDCSSYVTWVILEAGYRSDNFKEGMYQWLSSTFYNNKEGWTVITNIGQAKAGDILCYDGHVEIYAGSFKGTKAIVYNCGGPDSIKSEETSVSGHTILQIKRILRVPI
jgi:spore germination cell wall hydrolase CwlJ-like protein